MVDHLAGGLFRVPGEVILRAGTEEQLVAEEAAVGIEDGLAAKEAAGNGDGRRGSDGRAYRFRRRSDGRHAMTVRRRHRWGDTTASSAEVSLSMRRGKSPERRARARAAPRAYAVVRASVHLQRS